MARIVSIYIVDDAPRQLNLTEKERVAILHAFETTTHPSAFIPAAINVESTLRQQAHPNFIRWTICNGNRARILFARSLGVSLIVLSILAEILLTLTSVSRAWRIVPMATLLIGIATLAAAWKGMCMLLHTFNQRHVRPWELFADPEDALQSVDETDDTPSDDDQLKHSSTISNSYEDEPWVTKYEGRNIVRKVFDRQVSVEEPALRKIQDIIVVQSLVLSLVLSCVIVGIFFAIPRRGKGIL